MKTTFYPLGALVGGVIGGLARGGFTYYNLVSAQDADGKILEGVLAFLGLIPSVGIGVLCGAIAGGFGRPLQGALLGAFLSAGVFTLFVIPVAFCFSAFGAEKEVFNFSASYLLQKALAGALAGAVGGWAGRASAASRKAPPGPVTDEKQVGEGIRVVHRTEPFSFDGVDQISILGHPVQTVETLIPFRDPGVEVSLIPFDPKRHALPDGSRPDYIHRFTRTDGYQVEFLVKDGLLSHLVESRRPS